MRISADKLDSGYMAYVAARANDKRVIVAVDGVEQRECITADEEAGFVLVCELDQSGRVQIDETGESLKTKVVHGAVKVAFIHDATGVVTLSDAVDGPVTAD